MNSKIATFLLAGAVFLGLVFYFCANQARLDARTPVLHLADRDIALTIANTPETRTQGLSGTKSLPENSGMLFVFDTPGLYAFWMKDMNYPLDIIWLDENFKIVHIASDISPDTYPGTFEPTEISKYVLEVNAHFADENGLKVGDILDIPLK